MLILMLLKHALQISRCQTKVKIPEMKVGDLVRVRYGRGDGPMGIIVTEPRWGVNTMMPNGRTDKKLCEVLFSMSGQVATRGCDDLVVISESR
jgi:NMD protein affecting ribosome stability and mRNA decay